MLSFMLRSPPTEPPLHAAVLNDHCDEIRALSQDENARRTTNHLGFTALELAYLLDKKSALDILDPQAKRTIKIVPKGRPQVHYYSAEQFEKIFGIEYLSHPRFANYAVLQEVISNCPWILKQSWLGAENRQLGEQYKTEIDSGYIADLTIKWIDEVFGYGVFANESLPAGAYVGEYTGNVRRLSRWRPDFNAFCFHYPTRFWSWKYFVIDALHESNELRFINHSDQPNLEPICLLDRNLLHIAFVANQPIGRGMQLTFNYGEDFWMHRKKQEASIRLASASEVAMPTVGRRPSAETQ